LNASFNQAHFLQFVVASAGLEPATQAFSGLCSTN
jgi:hypothetical protein